MGQEVASKRVGRGANKRRRGTRGRRGTRSRGGRVRQGNRRGLEVSRGEGRSRGRQEVGGEGLGGSTWGRGPSTHYSLGLASMHTISRHMSHAAPISMATSGCCRHYRRHATALCVSCAAPLTRPASARALGRVLWLCSTMWQNSVLWLDSVFITRHRGTLPARRSGARLRLRVPCRTITCRGGLHGASCSHALWSSPCSTASKVAGQVYSEARQAAAAEREAHGVGSILSCMRHRSLHLPPGVAAT